MSDSEEHTSQSNSSDSGSEYESVSLSSDDEATEEMFELDLTGDILLKKYVMICELGRGSFPMSG